MCGVSIKSRLHIFEDRSSIPPTAVGGWLKSSLLAARWDCSRGLEGRTLTIPQLPLGGLKRVAAACRLDLKHPPTAVGGIEGARPNGKGVIQKRSAKIHAIRVLSPGSLLRTNGKRPCCYLAPLLSVRVIIRSTALTSTVSRAPPGHRISNFSTFGALPKPKCSRRSDCEQ